MCPECRARRKLMRDAFVQGKIKESVAHAAKGVAEVVGVKKKTGVKETQRPRRKKPTSK